MTFSLISPRPAFLGSYRSYIQELGTEERYPFPLDFDHHDFPGLLKRMEGLARGEGVPAGGVPSSTYWLVTGEALVGVSNLRHHLNPEIRDLGGHIGLSIRPTYRGRGLGQRLLILTLAQARMRGIDEVHLHCYKSNVPSARMITACGGMLHSETMDASAGAVVQRYRVAPPHD